MRVLGFRASVLAVAAVTIVVAVVISVRWVSIQSAAAPGGFTFSAAGDAGSWNGFDASRRALKHSGSDFFVALGDLSYGGDTEQHWCEQLKSSFPNVELLAGNHDTGEVNDTDVFGHSANINEFVKYCPFSLAPATYDGVYGKEYSFDYPADGPSARLILTGCGLDWVVDGEGTWDCVPGDAHYEFVNRSIDGARAAGIPWVFVISHKNCLATGEHTCELGPAFFNLLLEKKVDVILQGHTHDYERSKQLSLNPPTCPAIQEHIYIAGCVVDAGPDGRYAGGAGSVLVIAGTFGRDIDPTTADSPYAPYFAETMDNATPGEGKGFVTFAVDPGQVTLTTTFLNTTATPFSDTFTITKATGEPALHLAIEYSPLIALVASGAVLFVVVWRRRRSGARVNGR